MRKTILTAATCVAVALTGAASAKKPKKPEDPDKVICRLTMQSGSHIGQRRVCMTRAEWKMEEAARANEADSAIRRTWDRTEQNAPRDGPPF
ncbi:MAG TPA: hypothetical protein VEA60_10670 [Allosphingosinicella sp.]|nr:hypothetical protein [Allosphingosinicella sp.]